MFFRFGFTVLFSLLIISMQENGYMDAQMNLNMDCNSTEMCDFDFLCQYGTCRAMIGTDCATNGSTDECVQNITCTTDQPCSCPANQVPKADYTGCGNTVGGVCSTDDECLTNGTCGKDNKCACKPTFVSSHNSSFCKLAVNQTCIYTRDCGENSDCIDNKCACKMGFNASNGRCAKNVGAQCGSNAECSLMAECSNSACACKNPYVRDSSNNSCTMANTTITNTTTRSTSTSVTSSTLQGVGEQCDGTKKCRTDLICDHDVCKLKLGADCSHHNGSCQTGTACNNQLHNCIAEKNGATSLLASLLVVVGVLVTSRLI